MPPLETRPRPRFQLSFLSPCCHRSQWKSLALSLACTRIFSLRAGQVGRVLARHTRAGNLHPCSSSLAAERREQLRRSCAIRPCWSAPTSFTLIATSIPQAKSTLTLISIPTSIDDRSEERRESLDARPARPDAISRKGRMPGNWVYAFSLGAVCVPHPWLDSGGRTESIAL
jgi:hypothetical protein